MSDLREPSELQAAEREQSQLRPQIDVDCHGDPRELGLAIGVSLRERIRAAERLLPDFETFRLYQPWWMPTSVFYYVAQRRARWALEPGLTANYPAMQQRLLGIAEGAQTSVEFLYLFHAMESASTGAYDVLPNLAACTAVAVDGTRTADRHSLLAHNFDLVPATAPLLSLRRSSGSGPLRSIGLSLAPMAGIIDGINEHGLSITYNYAPTTDCDETGPPVSLAIDDALGHCSTVTQAIERITSYSRGGGALLMLADARGEIAALELSAHHHHSRPAGAGGGLRHSNAYRSRAMQRFEMPRTAVYSERAPQALRGTRVFQSATRRDMRLSHLLRDRPVVDTHGLKQLMADHGRDGVPGSDTICMHGSHWTTLATVQLHPSGRTLSIAYGPACQATFTTFAV